MHGLSLDDVLTQDLGILCQEIVVCICHKLAVARFVFTVNEIFEASGTVVLGLDSSEVTAQNENNCVGFAKCFWSCESVGCNEAR